MGQGGGGGGGQQGQGGGDNSMAVAWLMILFMVTAYFIWYRYHAEITAFIFRIKLFEARFISLFTGSLSNIIAELEYANPNQITFEQLNQLSTVVGDYVRFPVFAILSVLAYLLYVGNPISRFRKIYSMKTLANQERPNWPHISPVLKLDLVNKDIDKGPWAMALTPMMFAKQHHLLKRNPRVVEDKVQAMNVSRVVLIGSEAKKIFSLQMGPYWEGPENLPIHSQALFAAFAAKINRDDKACRALLTKISDSTYAGALDFTGYKELLHKYYNTKLVMKVMQSHGYVLTLMASMIEKSRDDGVLATATFLWLKPIDRPLWFMLNSVGRQTPYAEVAGPFGHWLAEKEIGHRIMVPVVEEAVNGLEKAVKDVKISDEDLAELD